jgi:PPOX class probable F420-dependent enzyme
VVLGGDPDGRGRFVATRSLASIALLAALGPGASFAPDVSEALEAARYIYVATRRVDGTTSTKAPVWFVFDGQALYFTTAPGSHKVRRIRGGSPVLVWVGREDGPHFEGRAALVTDPAVAEQIAPAYKAKYWLAWIGLFRPRPERVRTGKTVIVRVTPDDDASHSRYGRPAS